MLKTWSRKVDDEEEDSKEEKGSKEDDPEENDLTNDSQDLIDRDVMETSVLFCSLRGWVTCITCQIK